MTRACVCGNVLERRGAGTWTMRCSPCSCASPGPRVGQLRHGLHPRIGRVQYEERTRLGLPLIADCERMEREV